MTLSPIQLISKLISNSREDWNGLDVSLLSGLLKIPHDTSQSDIAEETWYAMNRVRGAVPIPRIESHSTSIELKYLFYENWPLTFHIWLTIGVIILVNIANKWCAPAKFYLTELGDSHKIRFFCHLNSQKIVLARRKYWNHQVAGNNQWVSTWNKRKVSVVRNGEKIMKVELTADCYIRRPFNRYFQIMKEILYFQEVSDC